MIRQLIFTIIIIFMFLKTFQLNGIYTDIFYAVIFLVLGMVIGMIADYLKSNSERKSDPIFFYSAKQY